MAARTMAKKKLSESKKLALEKANAARAAKIAGHGMSKLI